MSYYLSTSKANRTGLMIYVIPLLTIINQVYNVSFAYKLVNSILKKHVQTGFASPKLLSERSLKSNQQHMTKHKTCFFFKSRCLINEQATTTVN